MPTKTPLDFDTLVSGLLKVDPKQMPAKPGKKKVGKKAATAQAKKAEPKKK